MDVQNLAYALTQVVHNVGAVAVVGGAVAGRGLPMVPPACRRLVWLLLIGWSLQAASGTGFGAISYVYYGQFPDIHGVAVAALWVKVVCATVGIVFAHAFLLRREHEAKLRLQTVFAAQLVLGATALTAAAFLRWFS